MLLAGCKLGLFYSRKRKKKHIPFIATLKTAQLSPPYFQNPFMLGLGMSKVICFCAIPHGQVPEIPCGQTA